MKKISNGKVRDIYQVDEDKLMLVVSDRISAFDIVMPNDIPDKGVVLNRLSEFWFDYIKDIIPNHKISTKLEDFPKEFQTKEFEGRSMLVKKLKMLPVECIVRGYITGSGWIDYRNTGSICGIRLPDDLEESQKFDEPLFTPSTKAEIGEHDENISFEEVCRILGDDLANRLKNATISVYKKCSDYALSKGIIIADTKFEFGLDKDNNLILADEVLTPDSSRFWPLDDYVVGKPQKSYDKQYLRDWLKQNGFKGEKPERLPIDVINITRSKYIEAYEKITNKTL